MDELKVFRSRDYHINDAIVIHQPTLEEIAEYGEKEYFGLVRSICSTPADQKVRIWDLLQKFWDEIDEFELFTSIMVWLKEVDTSIIFPSLDIESFERYYNSELNEMILRNKDGVVIDRVTHQLITNHIRAVHVLKKNMDVGYNKTTKRNMIEDDRDDMAMAMRKPQESNLWPLISAMTNCVEFKYRFDDVWTLPIGVFMDAVRRVQKQKDYNHTMQGIYGGNIDYKKINKKELNWIGRLE